MTIYGQGQTNSGTGEMEMEVKVKLAPKYLYSAINMCLNFYVGWGLTYCFTRVDVGITPIPENPLLKCFGDSIFLCPRLLSFDFCCDFELWT